jgi:D-sedoheptulose 7-phosphate isomerase
MSQKLHPMLQPTKAFAGAYLERFHVLLQGLDLDKLARVVDCLHDTRAAGGTVFIAGNGGSAATASHWANDLGKATKVSGEPPIRVLSLSDNVSWFTALANDEGYERVFSGQLENFARPGDVLIVISASGNSPNLVNAVSLARERKMATVGLLGFDGGILKSLVDHCLLLASEKGAYGPVESAHSLVCHLVTACLMQPSTSLAERAPGG